MTQLATPPADERHAVFLDPGDFHFGGAGTRISTLLGSCVSITLWHPRARIGGMCHYMLAERPRRIAAAPDGRYADEAFALFLQAVRAAGTRPGEYQAKLFGGANMFRSGAESSLDIGARNIDAGRRLLAAHHVTLVAEHVGGSGRRKLHFDIGNGNVWLAFPEGSGAQIRNTFYG
ncbi:MAG: chemotaxis protein CheD [Candidatus Accumulibacter sp. 66-26]|nr:chemotaxis protein CheD [Accumulibacter sp.]OJW46031.1 MAG: chemotaxis protein CheD [Candidatus Accumulibacter sp. 66-26]